MYFISSGFFVLSLGAGRAGRAGGRGEPRGLVALQVQRRAAEGRRALPRRAGARQSPFSKSVFFREDFISFSFFVQRKKRNSYRKDRYRAIPTDCVGVVKSFSKSGVSRRVEGGSAKVTVWSLWLTDETAPDSPRTFDPARPVQRSICY